MLSERGFGGIFGIWGMGCCLDGDLGASGGEDGRLRRGGKSDRYWIPARWALAGRAFGGGKRVGQGRVGRVSGYQREIRLNPGLLLLLKTPDLDGALWESRFDSLLEHMYNRGV